MVFERYACKGGAYENKILHFTFYFHPYFLSIMQNSQ
jgi:hypothetical protein